MTTLTITLTDDGSFVLQNNTIYAYVESSFNDEQSKEVLNVLKAHIENIETTNDFQITLNYYDSAKFYPHLVNTDHAHLLFKRWQLEFKQLTHKKLDFFLTQLKNQNLHYHGLSLKFDVQMEYLL